MTDTNYAFNSKARSIVIIDGPSLYRESRKENVVIEYAKLRDFLNDKLTAIRINYFTAKDFARNKNGETNVDPLYRLLHWMKFNGYSVHVTEGNLERVRNAEMLMNAFSIAAQAVDNGVEQIVIISNSRAFLPLIYFLKARDVQVCLIGPYETGRWRISDDLRASPDTFINLLDLLPEIKNTELEQEYDSSYSDEE